MSADYEMTMAVFLKDEIPLDVFAALRYMLDQDSDVSNQEPPSNPFSGANFTSAYGESVPLGLFPSYHPSTDYPPTYAGLQMHTDDPEEFMLGNHYGGGYTHFPGDYGAALRKVYRYNLPANQGGAPVYTWMLSFRVAFDMDGFEVYWDFASTVASYSESVGFVGYFRSQYADTPTLLYCQDGRLLVYDVPWIPENLKGDE